MLECVSNIDNIILLLNFVYQFFLSSRNNSNTETIYQWSTETIAFVKCAHAVTHGHHTNNRTGSARFHFSWWTTENTQNASNAQNTGRLAPVSRFHCIERHSGGTGTASPAAVFGSVEPVTSAAFALATHQTNKHHNHHRDNQRGNDWKRRRRGAGPVQKGLSYAAGRAHHHQWTSTGTCRESEAVRARWVAG